jgi:hypothetical protein
MLVTHHAINTKFQTQFQTVGDFRGYYGPPMYNHMSKSEFSNINGAEFSGPYHKHISLIACNWTPVPNTAMLTSNTRQSEYSPAHLLLNKCALPWPSLHAFH